MIEINYLLKAEDRLDFEREYKHYCMNQSNWFGYIVILRILFIILFGLLVFNVIQQIERAAIVFCLAFILFWGFQWLTEAVEHNFRIKGIKALPDSENVTVRIDEENYTYENLGFSMSFPLMRASGMFIESGYIYVDFYGIGRMRIPLDAFPNSSVQQEVERIFKEKIDNRNLRQA